MRNIKIRLFTLVLTLTLTAVLFLAQTVKAATPEQCAANPTYPGCGVDPCVANPYAPGCNVPSQPAAKPAAAQPAASQPAAQSDTTAAKTPDSAVELPNPLGDTYDPRAIIGNIIQGVLGLIGSIALVLFIWGGFEIMLSRGGPGIKKGQDTMVWAAVGLAVVFGSYAITNYIINKIISQ